MLPALVFGTRPRYYLSQATPGDFIMAQTDIVSLQKEGKKFKPSAAFVKHAHIKSAATYKKLHAESIRQPQKFWTRVSKELHWFKPWKKLHEWNEPFAKWFIGGQINVAYNFLA